MHAHQIVIADAYEKRKVKNPAYSLRAFARDLGVSVTSLSQVLTGKRKFSRQNLTRIAEKLELYPGQVEKLYAGIYNTELSSDSSVEKIEIKEDNFRLIADWYYLALLSLAECKNESSDAVYLSRRLGLAPEVAKNAVARLLRMDLIEIKNEKLRRKSGYLKTTDEIPSASIKVHHRQKLEKAIEALDAVPLHLREVSSLTFAVDSKIVVKVKREIQQFKKKIEKLCESSKPNEVYTLSVQFFPLSKLSKGESK